MQDQDIVGSRGPHCMTGVSLMLLFPANRDSVYRC